jgi:hypothetical protein
VDDVVEIPEGVAHHHHHRPPYCSADRLGPESAIRSPPHEISDLRISEDESADAHILATPNVGVAAISARKERHLVVPATMLSLGSGAAG